MIYKETKCVIEQSCSNTAQYFVCPTMHWLKENYFDPTADTFLWCGDLPKSHSSQIQQVSECSVPKSSNFSHQVVSMREVFPENFSVITQFSLPLWLQSVRDCPKNFFFHFQRLLLTDSFCCQSYWSYFLNLTKYSFKNIYNKKLKAIFFMIITYSSCKENCKKLCSLPVLPFLSSFDY